MNNWRDEKYFPLIYLQLYKKQVLHFSRGYFDYTLSFSFSLSLLSNESRKWQTSSYFPRHHRLFNTGSALFAELPISTGSNPSRRVIETTF